MKLSIDYAKHYSRIHTGESGKNYAGKVRGVPQVRDLVTATNPQSLLDYGSGKGYQYLVARVHEQWGGLLPYCYDLGVRQLAGRPTRKFDGIICCDMMEHIAEPDVDLVLADIFSLLSDNNVFNYRFTYFHIDCGAATNKNTIDGKNVHLTQREPKWWRAKLEKYLKPKMYIVAHFGKDGDELTAEAFKLVG